MVLTSLLSPNRPTSHGLQPLGCRRPSLAVTQILTSSRLHAHTCSHSANLQLHTLSSSSQSARNGYDVEVQLCSYLSLQSPFHSPLPQGLSKRTSFTTCPRVISWPMRKSNRTHQRLFYAFSQLNTYCSFSFKIARASATALTQPRLLH